MTTPCLKTPARGRFALAPALAVIVALFGTAGCTQSSDAPSDAAAASAANTRSSSAGLPSGNRAAGELLANTKGAATGQSCIDCHGVDGNAPIDPSYPKLGGQYHDYLGHSLQAYRDGNREHVLMSNQAANLTDQQIADLAVYFGSRESQLRDLHGVH
ncbi:MAG: c-type cytochrome [Pseudomonadota bacterium]|nr:c-type cytochrome [Pseudomonadota bacterium]